MRGLVWLHTVMSITRALVIHNEMYMKNVLITGKILRKIERWQSTTSNNHKQSRSQERLNSEQVWNGKIWTEIETGKL
jgi:hypothetical protein